MNGFSGYARTLTIINKQKVSISQDVCDSQLLTCVSFAFNQLEESESYVPSITTPTTVAPTTTASTSAQCQAIYYHCLGGGQKQQLCLCDLSACNGEDTAHSRASCSRMSVEATATSTPTCFYGSQATGSSSNMKAMAGDNDRKSTRTTNAVTGGAASRRLNLLGMAAAIVAPVLV